MYRERDYFPQGINLYVPAMQMAYGVSSQMAQAFSLGTPAASDDDVVTATLDGDATAGTETLLSWTSDSPYGRQLIYTPSGDPGATLGVYDVYGWDYLGQLMIERFSGINGSTAVVYGKKAFYRLWKAVVITASGAILWDIGTGTKLGLPYKSEVVWAKENALYVPVYKHSHWEWRDIAGAAVSGGPSGAWIHAPFPGYIKTVRGTANLPAGSTNDPAVTVELATVAITGLTITLDVSAAATEADAVEVDTPTTAGYNANNRFDAGDHIEIVVTDADTSGAISVGVEMVPTQCEVADQTDPQTATTGDPRGFYEPITPANGSQEIIVGLLGDNSVNSSGNGGLHGIEHYDG